MERNAVALGLNGYADHYSSQIDAIELLDASGRPLPRRNDGSVLAPRGLVSVGYQILHVDSTPLPGFDAPLMNTQFNRMPAGTGAVKMIHAPGSGRDPQVSME